MKQENQVSEKSLLFPATTFLSLSAILVVLSGCGNMSGVNSDLYYKGSSSSSAATAGGDVTGGITLQGIPFICPSSPNVVPYYDVNFDGTDRFKVCESGVATEKIAIYGRTKSANTLCAFPALSTGSGLQLFQNGASSAYSQCARMDIGDPVITFDKGISFNAVFIVEAPYEAQMRNCLTLRAPSLCPQPYSFGVFREAPTSSTSK